VAKQADGKMNFATRRSGTSIQWEIRFCGCWQWRWIILVRHRIWHWLDNHHPKSTRHSV